MNQLGDALTVLDDPPVKLLFVYNANPVATIPNQRSVRAGLARDDLFTVVFDAVWTDTARSPTSCCRRPRSWSTPSCRAATARTRCRRRGRWSTPWVRRGRTTTCSASWCGASAWRAGRSRERRRSSTPCSPARPTGRGCAPTWRATGARSRHWPGAGPDRRRVPAHADGKDRLCSRGAGSGGARRPLRLSARPGDGSGAAGADLAGVGPHHQLDVRAARARPGSPRAVTRRRAPRGIGKGDRVRVFNTLGEVLCRASSTPTCAAASRCCPRGCGAATPTTARPPTRCAPTR